MDNIINTLIKNGIFGSNSPAARQVTSYPTIDNSQVANVFLCGLEGQAKMSPRNFRDKSPPMPIDHMQNSQVFLPNQGLDDLHNLMVQSLH